MRPLKPIVLLLAAAVLTAPLVAKDNTPPRIRITKVKQGTQGNLSVLDFYIKAGDSGGVSYIKYRVAVNGKQSRWTRYPYIEMPGYENHLPFRIHCDRFVFEVYAVDRSRNKSRTLKRTFTGL